jgi:hypothetical protein
MRTATGRAGTATDTRTASDTHTTTDTRTMTATDTRKDTRWTTDMRTTMGTGNTVMATAGAAERRGAAAPAEPHAAERPQELVNYSTTEEGRDLVAETAALIGDLDDIEDAAVREKVFAALAAIDAVHREALHRLVRLFKEGVLEQVVTDPPIQTLMGM